MGQGGRGERESLSAQVISGLWVEIAVLEIILDVAATTFSEILERNGNGAC